MIAHNQDTLAMQHQPHTWVAPRKADPTKLGGHRPHHTCSYCGSVSPRELAEGIRSGGVVISIADHKYGWPHKCYVYGLPNIFAGQPEILSSSNGTLGPTQPAPEVSRNSKFYTEHLQDASPDDSLVIQRAIGYQFKFTDGHVAWSPFKD